MKHINYEVNELQIDKICIVLLKIAFNTITLTLTQYCESIFSPRNWSLRDNIGQMMTDFKPN